MVNDITRTAGIDTGKDRLDVAIHGGGDPFAVENTPAGWQSLAARLSQEGVQRVGIARVVRVREQRAGAQILECPGVHVGPADRDVALAYGRARSLFG